MGHNIQARGKYTIQTWPLLSATQEIWGCAEGFGTHPIAPATSGKGRPGLRYIAKVLNWKVLISHSHKWHPRRSSTESPTFIEYPTSHYGNFEVASEFRPTYTCVFISHRWLSQSPQDQILALRSSLFSGWKKLHAHLSHRSMCRNHEVRTEYDTQ